MPSPFPGMDPYVEDPHLWPDFHNELAVTIRRAINRCLPDRYVTWLEEHHVSEPQATGEVQVAMRPDVAVHERLRSAADGRPDAAGTGTAIAPPIPVALTMDVPVKAVSIEIRTRDDDRLVTAIEIPSPSNKRRGSRDQRTYSMKRERLMHRGVHFLEIDLLRGGERWAAVGAPDTPYRALLCRGGQIAGEAWPLVLTTSLPTIAVPLLAPDPDLPLDLQAAFTTVYDEARFDRLIEYGRDVPAPALAAEDAAFVVEALAKVR